MTDIPKSSFLAKLSTVGRKSLLRGMGGDGMATHYLQDSLSRTLTQLSEWVFDAFGGLGATQLPNGFFDLQSDEDALPDGWTLTEGDGVGVDVHVVASSRVGANAVRIGNGTSQVAPLHAAGASAYTAVATGEKNITGPITPVDITRIMAVSVAWSYSTYGLLAGDNTDLHFGIREYDADKELIISAVLYSATSSGTGSVVSAVMHERFAYVNPDDLHADTRYIAPYVGTTSADINAWINITVDKMDIRTAESRPAFRADKNGSNQALSGAATTTISFVTTSTKAYDHGAVRDLFGGGSANNGYFSGNTFTVPYTGLWTFTANVTSTGSPTGGYNLYLVVDAVAAAYLGAATTVATGFVLNGSTDLYLEGGQAVNVQVVHSADVTISGTATHTWFTGRSI